MHPPTPPPLTMQYHTQQVRLRSQGRYVQREAAPAVALCEGGGTACLLLESTDVTCRRTLVSHLIDFVDISVMDRFQPHRCQWLPLSS